MRCQAIHQKPESRSVIVMREMGDFMRDDIVDDGGGRENETPGEAELAAARAGSPARARIRDTQRDDAAADRGRLRLGEGREETQRLRAQEIPHAPGDEFGSAADAQEVAIACRRSPQGRVVADGEGHAEDLDDSAIGERHRWWNLRETGADPVGLAARKTERGLQRGPARQDKDDVAAARVGTQGDAARARMPPQDEAQFGAVGVDDDMRRVGRIAHGPGIARRAGRSQRLLSASCCP